MAFCLLTVFDENLAGKMQCDSVQCRPSVNKWTFWLTCYLWFDQKNIISCILNFSCMKYIGVVCPWQCPSVRTDSMCGSYAWGAWCLSLTFSLLRLYCLCLCPVANHGNYSGFLFNVRWLGLCKPLNSVTPNSITNPLSPRVRLACSLTRTLTCAHTLIRIRDSE